MPELVKRNAVTLRPSGRTRADKARVDDMFDLAEAAFEISQRLGRIVDATDLLNAIKEQSIPARRLHKGFYIDTADIGLAVKHFRET